MIDTCFFSLSGWCTFQWSSMLLVHLNKVIIRVYALVDVVSHPFKIMVEWDFVSLRSLVHLSPVFLIEPVKHKRWLVHHDGEDHKFEELLFTFILYFCFSCQLPHRVSRFGFKGLILFNQAHLEVLVRESISDLRSRHRNEVRIWIHFIFVFWLINLFEFLDSFVRLDRSKRLLENLRDFESWASLLVRSPCGEFCLELEFDFFFLFFFLKAKAYIVISWKIKGYLLLSLAWLSRSSTPPSV